MTKLIALVAIATATLTACAVDPGTPEATCGASPCPDSVFTLDASPFASDGGRLLTDTSGPLLGGSIHVAHAAPRAYIAGKPVGAPALVQDGTWSLQLPEGTISGREVRVVLELDLVAGEPAIIEQTFALADGAN